MRIFSTKHQANWWKHRPIDWGKEYLSTWNHPHRFYLASILKQLKWRSLFEVGVGAGANIVAFYQAFPQAAMGGCDVSPEAIKVAKQALPSGLFDVAQGDDILMSDESSDIVLSDMCLIYVGPFKIRGYLKEMKRIARNYVILCEFYHPSFWKRLKMTLAGRYTHNYPQLLEKLGCYDIVKVKMPREIYPGAHDHEYRYLIIGRI